MHENDKSANIRARFHWSFLSCVKGFPPKTDGLLVTQRQTAARFSHLSSRFACSCPSHTQAAASPQLPHFRHPVKLHADQRADFVLAVEEVRADSTYSGQRK
ncbi:hypothetical protein JOB18_049369 [Solea senegalensis]|uniref:Uncharacterized protein n=1 Tax=Solea senegalensis TaxID=28829 RepID=A0AAV6QTF3_SOLSE|nr:hypothetical protein JOB18_049369 [Solea senegalensis]